MSNFESDNWLEQHRPEVARVHSLDRAFMNIEHAINNIFYGVHDDGLALSIVKNKTTTPKFSPNLISPTQTPEQFDVAEQDKVRQNINEDEKRALELVMQAHAASDADPATYVEKTIDTIAQHNPDISQGMQMLDEIYRPLGAGSVADFDLENA